MAGQRKNKKSLREEAYKLIKDRILFLDLKPGEKVFEAEVADILSASRTPVREALFALEHEGLVECDAKLGYIVKSFSGKNVEEYIGIRKALELYATPLIVERITPGQTKALKKNIQTAKVYFNKKDLKNSIRCETEFHQILYKATGSDIFFNTISSLVDKFQLIRAIALFGPDGPSLSLTQHEMILEAIERRDVQKLEKTVILHLNAALEEYKKSPAVALFERSG
jgi:DNA-binding GntR family transcriptional regulator